jgi:Crp-like helix-turn-helix protein
MRATFVSFPKAHHEQTHHVELDDPRRILRRCQEFRPATLCGPIKLRTLDGASHIELGFPYELYAKDMPRAFAYGGMRDRILACFCREHPDVGLKVIAVVGSRLRRLVGIIEELSFTTVRQRLIALVLRLAQADGTPSKEGIRVELAKSHQDLAAELGTVLELVSRNLSRLQAEGFLDVEGRKIVCGATRLGGVTNRGQTQQPYPYREIDLLDLGKNPRPKNTGQVAQNQRAVYFCTFS